jgi:hypothetical protein
MDAESKALIQLTKAINQFAASYNQPVEKYAHTFFSGFKCEMKPELIAFMKTTNCRANIASDWANTLAGMGYDSSQIRLLEDIKLRENQKPLKEALEHYANNLENAHHTVYQAIQFLTSDHVADPGYNQDLKQLLKANHLDVNEAEALALYLQADKNMKEMNMTPLASTLEMTEKVLSADVGDDVGETRHRDFRAAQQALLALEASSSYTQDAIKSEKADYLQEKLDTLIEQVINNGNISDFVSDLQLELQLLDLCGQDIQALKSTFDVLTDISSENKTLLGIQKIIELAKTRDISSEENLLSKISENYGIEQRLLASLAQLAQAAPKGQSRVITECALIARLTESKLGIDDVAQRLSTLNDQLAALFKNNQSLHTSAQRYITERKQELIGVMTQGNLEQLQKLSNRLNVVDAFGTMLNDYKNEHEKHMKLTVPSQRLTNSPPLQNNKPDDVRERLASLSKKNDDRTKWVEKTLTKTHKIAGLAAFMRDMQSRPKAEAINTAITGVLHSSPDMTFDTMIRQLNGKNLEKGTPLFELKKAINTHQKFFMRIISLFYPIETKTAKYFREQLQSPSEGNPNTSSPRFSG